MNESASGFVRKSSSFSKIYHHSVRYAKSNEYNNCSLWQKFILFKINYVTFPSEPVLILRVRLIIWGYELKTKVTRNVLLSKIGLSVSIFNIRILTSLLAFF